MILDSEMERNTQNWDLMTHYWQKILRSYQEMIWHFATPNNWCLLHLFWRRTVIVQEMDNLFWHVAMDSMEKAVKLLWVALLFYAVIDETLL